MSEPSAPIIPATSTESAAVYSPPRDTPLVVASEIPSLALWGAIRTPSQGPAEAIEARFTCDACNESTVVYIGRKATTLDRQIKMKEALDLHRILCKVGLPEDMRTYRINYPR